MKFLILTPILVALLVSCDTGLEHEKSVTGVYVRQFQNEFGTGWDTVMVDADPRNANSYIIRHHTQIIRQGAGQVAFPERKELVLPATWNDQNNLLVTNRLGRRYAFPEQGVVMLGTARYQIVE